MRALGADREVVLQQILSFALTVPVTPARRPLSDVIQSAAALYIDTITLGLHIDAAHPVYYGGPGVIGGLASNGIQLNPGEKITIGLSNERPLYEVQGPLVDAMCADMVTVPIVAWQLDNIWVTTDTAAVVLAVQLFPVPFR